MTRIPLPVDPAWGHGNAVRARIQGRLRRHTSTSFTTILSWFPGYSAKEVWAALEEARVDECIHYSVRHGGWLYGTSF